MGLRRLRVGWQRCHLSAQARGGTGGVFPVIWCLWEVFCTGASPVPHIPRALPRAGMGLWQQWCFELSPASMHCWLTAETGETWGRAALGRDGCMQTLSGMVLGKTGVLPEIQKTCSGTENFLFLPISFSFPLSPFPSPPAS